jgi:hypothetical protein
MNELSTPGQNAPAPGSPPVPLPVVGQTTTSGPPPDFSSLGAGQAQADFAAASANGGWKFDAAAMDKVIQNLEDSLDGDYADATRAGRAMALITDPGSDDVSRKYITAAVNSGIAHNRFLTGAIEYVDAYVNTLKKIRTAYVNRDQTTIDTLRGIRKAD